MYEIMKIAKLNNLKVVEDACMGSGASLKGKSPGTFGDISAFSFHPLKSLNVIGDFRAPNIIRFGFTPLYTSYENVWRAVDILSDILHKEIWKDPVYSVRSLVT